MSIPYFSIITVVYNDSLNFKKTLTSLFHQNCNDFELIVIDGYSSDDSILIAKDFLSIYGNYTTIKILSEKDNGIYDAMNKGINMASGKWIFFLNAGDVFYDTSVLKVIKNKVEIFDCDIIYGNHARNFFKNIIYPPKKINYFTLNRYLGLCHQTIFCKKETIQNFDTNFSLIADFVWLVKQNKRLQKIVYINKTIVLYDTQGKSSNTKLLKKEFLQFLKQYSYINYLIRLIIWKIETK